MRMELNRWSYKVTVMAESLEPVLDVVAATTTIVLNFKH